MDFEQRDSKRKTKSSFIMDRNLTHKQHDELFFKQPAIVNC